MFDFAGSLARLDIPYFEALALVTTASNPCAIITEADILDWACLCVKRMGRQPAVGFV
jgi:hypothetical protein